MPKFKFLKYFPEDKNGMYIIYELYSFDNIFRLLLKNNFSHEQAINFIIANCSLSGLVFQERIHNKQYNKLSAKDVLSPEDSAIKARLIYEVMECNSSIQ